MMIEEISRQLIQSGFMPNGYYLSWSPPLLGMYIVSDALIFLSYFSMPLALGYFVRKRPDFPYKWLLWMFAAFILMCGATHLMGIIILWQPLYWIDATLKAMTAAISVATAIALWPMIPHALRAPTNRQLHAINDALQKEIAERRRIEEELRLANEQLQELHRRKDASLTDALHRLDAHLGISPLAIIEFDPAFRVTRWSETAEHLFGWSAEEIVGRAIAEIRWVHEEDAEAVERVSAAMLSGASPRNRNTNRNYRKDGSIIHCDWYNSAIYDGQGKLVSILSQVLDITESVRVEEALLDTERRYKALFSNKTNAIAHLRIVTDQEGKPVNYCLDALNEACEGITGIKNEAILGKLVTDVFPGIENAEFDSIREYGRIGLEGGEATFEAYFPPTGRWLSIYAYSPGRGEVNVFMTDKTAHKTAELDLAHEKEMLSTIVENIPVMLCVYDAKLKKFQLNRHLEDVLGWTTEDANDGDFMAKVIPDPGYRSMAVEFMQKLTPGWREFQITAKGGSVVASDWANIALSDDSRVGIGIDLRERKQAQGKLALHAERQALLLDIASGILQTWGDKAEMARVLFEKVKDHLDADVCLNYRLLPDSDNMDLVAALGVTDEVKNELQYLPRGHSFSGTVAATGMHLVADNDRIATDKLGILVRQFGMHAYMVHPLLGLDGRVIGTLSLGSARRDRFESEEVDLLRTIAYFLSLAWERRRAEQQITNLNADLERRVEERTAELLAANRELEGFTFATSHDLRGPLGRINSFSALLEKQYRQYLEGDGLLFLNLIRQNATRLLELVGDLLNHARVTQHALELQAVDISALTKFVLQDKADDLREAGAEIHLDLRPAHVMGDPHSLHQVLGNLLENAVKYSAKSTQPVIEIGGKQEGEHYCLWVHDNGIGFNMAYHDKIFEMFRRLHTYNEYPGTGVGLALVKRAMERMGGRVWAESLPGHGATFFLEMQTEPIPGTPAGHG